MKLKAPINENYAGTVVTISTSFPLENCDNVKYTNIFGNMVVVGKDVSVGDKGIFFPVETKLSEDFLRENNLYRDKTLNKDTNIKGYFELNGRIRCVKFRGNKSEGIFLPITSILFAANVTDVATLKENDTFDEINGIKICEKYVIKTANDTSNLNRKQQKSEKRSILVDQQFRFHTDTAQLGKNIDKITPDTIISITNKLHGTSFVVSNILTKNPPNAFNRFIAWMFALKLIATRYAIIYSSRKVIKNDNENKVQNHYYKEDVWGIASGVVAPFLKRGMTVYGEIVGFTPSGSAIQGNYDYGYSNKIDTLSGEEYTENKHYGVYIYRITYTNISGDVFEFSARQVQEWCKSNGLKAVPEFFYGKAREIFSIKANPDTSSLEKWQGELLSTLSSSFNMEKDCELCNNKVPAEGIVVRIEGLDYNAYKLKAFRFKEYETKQLDKGEVDIETQES